MNPNRPARLNRIVLALVGLVLVAVGMLTLGVATGWLNAHLSVAAPQADDTLLTAEHVPGWTPWVAALTAIVAALLALRWLIAQALRRPATSTWQLATDTASGATHIDSGIAAQPLAEEIKTFPGVHDATVRLVGLHRKPHLYLRVSADALANISGLRQRIDAEAIPQLTQALALSDLAVDLLIHLSAAHNDAHVR